MPSRSLPRRRTIVAVAAVAALTMLLTALPASAHPFIRGGEAPVDSLASLTLAMGHGCGGEAESSPGSFTTDVALEVPEWMRIVETPPQDGWTIEHETGDDGEIAVVSWSTDDPVEAAPEFVLDVVVTGEPGQERFLSVFQGCGETELRWVGTPDDPAEEPAIALTLAAADPERPAPDAGGEAPSDGSPSDEPGTDPAADPSADPGAEPENRDEPEGGAEEPATSPETPGASEAPSDDADASADDADTADGNADATADSEAAASADATDADEGGSMGWVVAVIAAIVVIGGAFLVWKRSTGSDTPR